MSNAKAPCKDCGVGIDPSLGVETGGLCSPCWENREYENFRKKVRPLWGRAIVPRHSGRRWGRAIFAPRSSDRPHLAERYQAGDREWAWTELHELDLRQPTSQDVFDDAVECVRLTMRRVRTNVEILVAGLTALGYEFERTPAHVPPTPADLSKLAELENRYGPLPLTLRLFYEEVGTVDLRQNMDQWDSMADDSEGPESLGALCAYDPLCVTGVSSLDGVRSLITRRHLDPPSRRDRLRFHMGPNEHPKCRIYCDGAAFAGILMAYYVFLPEPAVDFPLVGAWTDLSEPVSKTVRQRLAREGHGRPDEFFMTHLRQCFLNAGFRGKSGYQCEDWRERHPPRWAPLRELAAKLPPV
jgi:hypothetical protein